MLLTSSPKRRRYRFRLSVRPMARRRASSTADYFGFLTGLMTLRKASMRSLRFGTGISNPFEVFCFGSCGLSVTHGEVSA
jgi:hypothetical protein